MSTEPVTTPAQTTSPWSVVSLISGIASYIALPFLGAIIALVTGYVAKDEIRKSNGLSAAKAWLPPALSSVGSISP
jgi:hypothetical protein